MRAKQLFRLAWIPGMLIQLVACEPTTSAWLEMISDENGDMKLSPGEQAEFQLIVTEVSSGSTTTSVSYKLDSPSEFVSIISGTGGTCSVTYESPGKCSPNPVIGLTPQIPAGTTSVPVVVEIEDSLDVAKFTFFIDTVVSDSESVATDGWLASVDVSSDSNSDGVFNPGETAVLNVTLSNLREVTLEGVGFTMSTDSPYVTILENESGTCGTFEPWEKRSCSTGWETGTSIQVATGVPSPTDVSFQLFVTDALSNSWAVPFTLPVWATAGQPGIATAVLSPESGDEDGQVTAGESGWLDIEMRNVGTSQLNGVVYALSSGDVLVNPEYATGTCGNNIAPGETGNCQTRSWEPNGTEITIDFLYELSDVTFKLDVSDAEGNTWELFHTMPLQ